MKRQTNFFFYILSFYLLVQFAWWGYLLIFSPKSNLSSESRIYMILGEGAVFLVLLLFGFWKIKNSIDKEIEYSKNQNNFLLSITHELKTPIASIKLYLQTLNKGKITPSQNELLLKNALKENNRLENLINNILYASAMDSHKMSPNKTKFHLLSFINPIVSRFKSQHPDCNINYVKENDFEVYADEFMLETVINNLLDNAIKYSGGNCDLNLKFTSSKTHFTLSILDNGPGIPKNQIKSIFNRFYRIENEETRVKKGSGLGLFIAKQFILLHKGSITYEKNIPNGSIFKISLPL